MCTLLFYIQILFFYWLLKVMFFVYLNLSVKLQQLRDFKSPPVLWFHLSKATGGIFVLACRHVVPCGRHKPCVGIPNEWVEFIYAEWYWKAWKSYTHGVILYVYTSIMSYGQNLVYGEGTSLSRVGTYQFCSHGNPMTHNTTLVIPNSVRF